MTIPDLMNHLIFSSAPTTDSNLASVEWHANKLIAVISLIKISNYLKSSAFLLVIRFLAKYLLYFGFSVLRTQPQSKTHSIPRTNSRGDQRWTPSWTGAEGHYYLS